MDATPKLTQFIEETAVPFIFGIAMGLILLLVIL